MADTSPHPTDALHEWLDGRLNAQQRTDVERHLETCEPCRRELEALRWTKDQTITLRAIERAPARIEAQLRNALDQVDENRGARGRGADAQSHATTRVRWLRRWQFGAAAVAAVVLVMLWVLPRVWEPTLPERVASTHRMYRAGTLALGIRTNQVTAIEAYFRRAGMPFDVPVFDLDMMKYEAEGGLVHRLADRPSALFVYRSPDGRVLLCQMLPGTLGELPEPGRRLTHKGVDVFVYQQQEITLVFWQEGDELCVLATEGDPQTVIQLAFMKAAKA